MKAPPRLLEDPEVSKSLSDDLRASRRVKAHYDTLAKLPQLRAALSAQGPAGAPLPDAQGARWNMARWEALPWTAKLSVLAAIGGAALGAAVSVTPRAPHMVAAPMAARLEAPRPLASTPAQLEAPRPPAPTAPAIAPVQPIAPGARADNKPRPARSASSSREVELLLRVRQLVERDPDRALRLAAQAEREFPSGALCEEREALQVLALARRGDLDEAQRRARDFLLRYPQSPMRARLQADLRKPR